VLLYYITDRSQFPGDESGRRAALLSKIAEAVHAGVDYIQLRERDLPTRSLETLALEAIRIVHESNAARVNHTPVRLLINSRTDVALAAGSAGVHLRSDDPSPVAIRDLVARACHDRAAAPRFLIARSCHSPEDVLSAASAGADFAVFAPVFEKKDAPDVRPAGLRELGDACRASIPVLALGGITLDNAATCIEAGAAGIAAIRLFQEQSISDVVRALRR
jgi:thiamine-phosphate pyrophosphorylase